MARFDTSWDCLCSSIILVVWRIASASLVVADPLPPLPLLPPPSALLSLSPLQNGHHAALGGSNDCANADAMVAMDAIGVECCVWDQRPVAAVAVGGERRQEGGWLMGL